MTMQTTRLLPLLLCFCVGRALASTPIQLRREASPTAHVSISNIAGTVTVLGWDRNEVQVGGELGDGAKPLSISGGHGNLSIKVEPQAGSGWFHWASNSRMGPTALEVHVPRAASLAISVISATLVIDGVAGGSIALDTVSGKARIEARTPSLKIDSVSGGIELGGYAEQADLQTVSGDILAPTLGSVAKLQTISGHIQANGGPWRKFSLSTVSGDVQLAGALAPGGTLAIDSMSGDVQLRLPPATSAALHANSFSGDLRSDFGTPRQADHGSGSSLDARLGDGQGRINIETFSGDLRIRRQR